MNLTRLFPGADPFLMKHNGKYYIYCTTENGEKLQSPNAFNTAKDGRDGFYVYQSEDLVHWGNKGLCLSNRVWYVYVKRNLKKTAIPILMY